MNDKKESQKRWNRNTTKKVNECKNYIAEEDSIIVYEGNKQRVNISVNSALWSEVDSYTENKSRFVEKLIVDYIQKMKGKEIILKKSIF